MGVAGLGIDGRGGPGGGWIRDEVVEQARRSSAVGQPADQGFARWCAFSDQLRGAGCLVER